MHMLYGTFEDAGMTEALTRGYHLMVSRLREIAAADVIDLEPGVLESVQQLPSWLWTLNFAELSVLHGPHKLSAFVEPLCLAERAFRRSSADRRPGVIAWECDVLGNAEARLLPETSLPPGAAREESAQRRAVASTVRLALGAAIEAALVDQALDTIPVIQRNAAMSASASASAGAATNGPSRFGYNGPGNSSLKMTPEQRQKAMELMDRFCNETMAAAGCMDSSC